MSDEAGHHLIRLRQIGWDVWDPIGIRALNDDAWQRSAADEYDAYLRKVAADLRGGCSLRDAAGYLVQIEREHMGLGFNPGQEARAEATVLAIQKCVTASS